MKIIEVEAIIIKVPKVSDRVDGTQDDLIVRIHTDEGLTGYGETDSSPYVAKAVIDAEKSHAKSQGLRELLLGRDPLDREQIWRDCYSKTFYYGRTGAAIHALSAVDLALWDLVGKIRGEPVWRLLGGRCRERVKAYGSTSMPDTPQEAYASAKALRKEGFGGMKFGWGAIGRNPQLDRELFQAVRQGAGDAAIMFDAGQCYDLKQAQRVCQYLLELGPLWLEEPLDPDDLDSYSRLCATSPLPIAAGETESGSPAFRRLIEDGGVDVVQPDLSRAGGFTEALKIAFLAAQYGRKVVPHAFKSNILLAASLHFCSVTPSADWIEYAISDSPIRRHLTLNDFPLIDGYITVPSAPGLGVEINSDLLEKLRYETQMQLQA